MATPVMMPNVGITVETCVLTKWLKQKGETVQEGEVLFTYETDKSTLEQEAPVSGTVLEIFFGEDSDVPVMTNVCVIGNPGEDFEEFRPGAAGKEDETPAAPVKEEAAPAQAVQSAPAAPVLNTGFIKASPRAKTLAGKRGVNLQYVSGTGPDGRIIERDVFA
ncbi:MAG: E3 binding domain-containing protein, partial [Clostridia bacterium]|nr:E3 binding domain-containing protein [Clostridia bacterium]